MILKSKEIDRPETRMFGGEILSRALGIHIRIDKLL